MPAERYASIIDVHVILRREEKLLLLRRAGNTWASGQLCLTASGQARVLLPHREVGRSPLEPGARQVRPPDLERPAQPPSAGVPTPLPPIELTELLQFVKEWLTNDNKAKASFTQFIGSPGYDAADLCTDI